jgi:hypothetical protein
LAINSEDKATKEACIDMLRSRVRQIRHRLKQKYFDGVPANEIPIVSPVPSMDDDEWNQLVDKWKDPKNMVCVSFHILFDIQFAGSSHFKPMISAGTILLLFVGYK